MRAGPRRCTRRRETGDRARPDTRRRGATGVPGSRLAPDATRTRGTNACSPSADGRRPFRALLGAKKTTLRGLKNECSRAETPRRKQPRAPRRTDVSPKKTNGTVNAPVHNSNRVRKRQMRRAVARRASLSNARRLAAFPAPLEKKRRKQTPGPTPVSRAAATSHARAHPFTALRDLNKTQEMPTE